MSRTILLNGNKALLNEYSERVYKIKFTVVIVGEQTQSDSWFQSRKEQLLANSIEYSPSFLTLALRQRLMLLLR